MRNKILAVLLSALMMISLCVPVLADEAIESQVIEAGENTQTAEDETILPLETEDALEPTNEETVEETTEVEEQAEEFDINEEGLTGYAVPLPEGGQIVGDLSLLGSGVPTQAEVYYAMMALKSSYPEGTTYTDANHYDWYGGLYTGGFGSKGFAFMLSDAAFGDLPARAITDVNISKVHVGDILRINNDSHSVIVTEVYSSYVVLAEGNYNYSVHWGRTLSAAEVANADFMLTRYPVGTFGESFTVTYDANGGYDAPETQIADINKGINISTHYPYRIGYEFLGWSTSKNASTPQYQLGAMYYGNQDVTLYAVWKKAVLQQITNDFPKTYTANILGEIDHVVYEFVPLYTGSYVFESYGDIDTVIEIFEGDGSEIGNSDDEGEGSNFCLSAYLVAGEKYFVMVGTWGDVRNCSYDFSVEIIGVIINSFPQSYDVDTSISGGPIEYTFVPSESAKYEFASEGNADTVLNIYDENGTLVGLSDDYGYDRNFYLEISLIAGKLYTVVVSTYGGSTGAAFKFTVDKKEVMPYVFYDMNMVIEESLNMNVYAALSQEVLNDKNSYCCVSYDGIDGYEIRKIIKVSDAKYSKELGMYVFSWDFVPAQMSDVVNVQIFYGDDKSGDTINVQVTDYIAYVLTNYDDYLEQRIKRVLIALTEYGDMAQTYFDYATYRPIREALINYSGNVTPNDERPDIEQSSEIIFDVPGINYYGSSLILENNPIVRHYFTLVNGYRDSDFVFRLNGVRIYPEYKDGFFYIDVYEGYLTQIKKSSDLTINGRGVYYPAATYVAKAVYNNAENDMKLRNLMLNFYRFYTEINYFVNAVG